MDTIKELQGVARANFTNGLAEDEMAVLRDALEIESSLTFDAALDRFVKVAASGLRQPAIGETVRLVVEAPRKGGRYVRVWRTDGAFRLIFAFVCTKTGDILKPATWKAPAKHARGNIFQASHATCTGPYGVLYLK